GSTTAVASAMSTGRSATHPDELAELVACASRKGDRIWSGTRPRTADEHCFSDGAFCIIAYGHVVQVEFHLPPPREDVAGDHSGLGLGIATALMEGMAEVIDVPAADLSVTIGRGGSAGSPVVVLYDAVPGGAGLVAQLEDALVFRASLEAAHRRVEGGCECG